MYFLFSMVFANNTPKPKSTKIKNQNTHKKLTPRQIHEEQTKKNIKKCLSQFSLHDVRFIWNLYFSHLVSYDDCFYSKYFQKQVKVLFNELADQITNQKLKQFLPPGSCYYWFKLFQYRQKLLPLYENQSKIPTRIYFLPLAFYDFVPSSDNFVIQHQFSQTKQQLKNNSTYVLQKIFKKVLAIRIYQSFKHYFKNNKLSSQDILNPNITKCKFTTEHKLFFAINFVNYVGSILDWGKDVGQFCIQMLKKIQVQFNIQFTFKCQYDFMQLTPLPFPISQFFNLTQEDLQLYYKKLSPGKPL